MNEKIYPSDLTDEEWEWIKDLIPAAKRGGRPRTLCMRAVLNAIFYVITGCEHLSDRCSRTTGSNWSYRTLSPTLKTKASGCQRPSKQWRFVPVCAHGHGGGDDSSGDTRLARGLPFGRMPVVRPPR